MLPSPFVSDEAELEFAVWFLFTASRRRMWASVAVLVGLQVYMRVLMCQLRTCTALSEVLEHPLYWLASPTVLAAIIVSMITSALAIETAKGSVDAERPRDSGEQGNASLRAAWVCGALSLVHSAVPFLIQSHWFISHDSDVKKWLAYWQAIAHVSSVARRFSPTG